MRSWQKVGKTPRKLRPVKLLVYGSPAKLPDTSTSGTVGRE